MARLKFLATRRGMRHAAKVQQLRRGGTDHRYVVGQFFLIAGRVSLWAVRTGPAYDVPRPPELTDQANAFCRWRTRQAAHQFATRWKLPDFHVIDLGFLDVLRPPASLQAVNAAASAELAGSQRTTCA